jgi:hypothetical protein
VAKSMKELAAEGYQVCEPGVIGSTCLGMAGARAMADVKRRSTTMSALFLDNSGEQP